MNTHNADDSGDNASKKSSQSRDSKASLAEKECAYCHSIPYQIISLTCDHNFCLNCAYFKIPTEQGTIPSVFVCEICKKPTLMSPDLQQALVQIFQEQKMFYSKQHESERGENLISQLDNNIQSNLPLYYSLTPNQENDDTEAKQFALMGVMERSGPGKSGRGKNDVAREIEETKHRLTTIFETIELNSDNNSNNREFLKESTATLLNNNHDESGRIEISVLESESVREMSHKESNLKKSYSFTRHFNEIRAKTEESNDKRDTKLSQQTQTLKDMTESLFSNKATEKNEPLSLKASTLKLSNLQTRIKDQLLGSRLVSDKESEVRDEMRDISRKQSFSEFLKVVNQNRKNKNADLKKPRLDKNDAKAEGRIMTERSDSGHFEFDRYRHFFKTSVDESNKYKKDLKEEDRDMFDRHKSKFRVHNKGSTTDLRQETIKEFEIQIKTKTNLLLNLRKEGEILKNNILERLSLNTEKYISFCDSMIRFFSDEKDAYRQSIGNLQAEIEKEYGSSCLHIKAKLIYCDKYEKSLVSLDTEDRNFLDALGELKKSFDSKLHIGKKTRNDFYEFFKQKIDKSFHHIKKVFSDVTEYVHGKMDKMSFYLFSEQLIPDVISKTNSKGNLLMTVPSIKFHLDQISNIVSELNVGKEEDHRKVHKSTDRINSRKAFKTVKKEPKEITRKSLDTKAQMLKRQGVVKKLVLSTKRTTNIKS